MGLLEDIAAAKVARSWPVGESATLIDRGRGHDDTRFSPASYGDYLATSNDIYSVASLRARHMGRLTPLLFNGAGPDRTSVTTGPAADLIAKVNPFWTFPRLIRMDELSMCVWGETYWAVNRNARGEPLEIWWMKPTQVKPIVHETDYLAGYEYTPLHGGPPIRFDVDEVIWFRYPNPIDEFSALAPVAAARLAADVASAGMKSNRKLFDQGLQLGGMIAPATGKATFSEDQAKDLEKALDRRWSGVDKAHKWAVLRFEAQFRGLDVTPKDAEFVDAMNLSARHVWRALGVPSPLLNDGEFATLANLQVYQTVLWEHTLVPEGDFLSAEIEEQLLPRYKGQADLLRFNYDDVPALQEAHTKTWDRERGQLVVGAITINEWRKKYGMPPVPWGDQPWMPVNTQKLTPEGDLPGGTTNDPAMALYELVMAEFSPSMNGHRPVVRF